MARFKKAPPAGTRFGRLTVLGETREPGRRKGVWCIVVCDCGTQKVVYANAMRRGSVRSCGCLQRELSSARATTHGQTKGHRPSTEHRIWSGAKNRCTNPNSRSWPDYGGRGITMCDRWRDSFEAFLADMGKRPSPEHSIDRIDNDGPYSPENCRWATRREQGANKRNSRIITHDGITRSINGWAHELGVGATTLLYRANAGWSDSEILFGRPRRHSCPSV